MWNRTTHRRFVSVAFSVLLAASVAAQVAPRVPINGKPQTPPTRTGQGRNAAAERHPACQRILAECRNLGFIDGQWKKDNGLWKDCFDPVVKGGQATRDGKPISVPVSQSDIQACRGAAAGPNVQNGRVPQPKATHP
jgi:hypothetical protein